MTNRRQVLNRHDLAMYVVLGVLLAVFCVLLVVYEPLLKQREGIIAGLLVLLGIVVFAVIRQGVLRRRLEMDASRRSAIQRLVSSLSLRILHVEASKIDAAVEQALRELGQCMGVDHIFLYQTTHEGRRQMLAPLANWHAEGAPETEYSSLVPLDRWNWLQDVIACLRLESVSGLGELPPEAAAEAADWQKAGIRSFAAAPVKGGRMTVFFWFLSMRRKLEWEAEDLQMVKLACGILASALENKFAEIKIRQSEERFRVALQDSPVAVFSQDSGLRYSWVYNPPSWMKAFSIIGHTDYDVYPTEIAERLTEIKRGVLTSGGVHHEEFAVPVAPGQTLVYDVTVEPLYDLEGVIAGITSAIVDITGVKRAAEERIALEDRIRESQKLESLAVMAGGVAHDFNNLLMIILGNAELAGRAKTGSEVTECLQAISGAGKRASELSRMMLTYAGRSGVNLRPVAISDLLKGMKAAVTAVIPKNVTLEYETDGQNLLAELDHAQIQQLVIHLINNAVEAVGESPGKVRVTAGGRMMTRQEFGGAVLGQDKPGGLYAFIEIADSGCGMDAEGRKHLFEPFYSTKSSGRGLGLSAVLGITRAHGGSIVVGSSPGCGTKITVYFPAKEQPENAAKAAAVQAGPTECEFPGRTQKDMASLGTILVVDDEESIRDLVQHVLEMSGYQVVPAGDGVSALSVFQKSPDRFSAAFLDLKMPQMDGYEVTRCLHRIRPDLPIIVLTGYNEEEATGHLAVNEIAAFLQKPCEMGIMLKTLKSVLARPAPTDPVWMP